MNDLLVIIEIAGRRCALRADDVRSVIELGTVAPVPGAPELIVGITALRSQTLTVIDCRKALGFDPSRMPTDERAAVVTVDGHSYALTVDAIEDIATSTSEPQDVAGGFGREWSGAAVGMIETTLGPALLLEIVELIAPDGHRKDDLGAAA